MKVKITIKKVLAGMLAVLMLASNIFAVPSKVTVSDTVAAHILVEREKAALFAISGVGTENDPFIVETEEDLRLVSDFPECHFKLANDIVLTSTDWEPLCVFTKPFSGIFDGDGHTILGLTITSSNDENGLFSENVGTIKNLNVMTGETGISLGDYTGIVVAKNSGTVEKCTVYGNAYFDGGIWWDVYAGGIVGLNSGTLRDCKVVNTFCLNFSTYSSFDATYIGNFVGANSGTINNCTATGDIICSGGVFESLHLGGFVGENTGKIQLCTTSGKIDVSTVIASTSESYNTYTYIGGFCGNNSKYLTKCSADVILKVDKHEETSYEDYRFVGGFLGYNEEHYATLGVLNECFAESEIVLGGSSNTDMLQIAYYYAGGLVGSNQSKVDNCAAICSISKLDDYASISSAGLINNHTWTTTGGEVSNCYAVASGELNSGLYRNSEVINSFYDKDISGKTESSYAKTTAAMKMKATYIKAGWDFDNTWGISEDINNGYPHLLWMYDKDKTCSEISFSTSMQAYLNLEGLISMSVGYKFTDMDSINPEDYIEKVGLLIWSASNAPDEAQATFDNCSNVIAGAFYNSEMGRFETTTEGIVAKKLGDALTFRAYYLDDNGNYTYGRLISNYSPKTYCYRQITNNADDEEAVELMASILNYGAAAQKFFDYRVDDLMNADLPEELK